MMLLRDTECIIQDKIVHVNINVNGTINMAFSSNVAALAHCWNVSMTEQKLISIQLNMLALSLILSAFHQVMHIENNIYIVIHRHTVSLYHNS